MKRQYMGCAGPGRQRDQHGAPLLVRDRTGHALIGARQAPPPDPGMIPLTVPGDEGDDGVRVLPRGRPVA